MSRARIVAVVALAAIAVGCSGGSDPTAGIVSGGPQPATLEDVQARVFTPRCAIPDCHVGTEAPFDLDLGDVDRSAANLIGVASAEVPAYPRVDPGNATDSYLYMKVVGDPRILGDRMPVYGAVLGADDLERIRDWIDRGRAMNRLSRSPLRPASDGSGGERPRVRVLAASAALHVLLIVGMMLIPKADHGDDPSKATRVVFYAPALPETAPPPLPVPPEPAPRPAVEPERPAPEPPPPLPDPPRPRPTPKVVRDRPTPPRPAPVEPRPEPAPRNVEPAGFTAPVPSEAPAPRRAARTGSFGTTAETAPVASEAPRSVARVDGFAAESAPAADGVRTDAPRVVARGSFGTENGTVASVAPSGRPAGAVVASTSFGSTTTGAPAAAPSRPAGTVNRGGFGDADGPAPAARPSSRRVRPAADLDTPVEIVAKPRPVYTNDARERRIEGEVVLQVTFDAAGTVQVHGVVQGLGFGLDEAAVDAAQEIEFKPARRDGRPVDHTATLRVVFRLA